MKSITHGWVVINPKHPSTGREMQIDSSFSKTRKESIKLFIQDSEADWKYWRNKYNYRVVKAKITIET